MFTLIAQSGSTSSSGGGAAGLIIPIALMGLLFYFMLIRPQKRRSQAQRQLTEAVEVGDEVIMAGGLFGTVRAIEDDTITVEIAPGTTVRMLRQSIARRLVDEHDEEPDEESDQPS